MKISNWGQFPRLEAILHHFRAEPEVAQILDHYDNLPLIPRGLGRCYGDSALNAHILETMKFNRFLSFDENTGLLVCEAGVSLAEIVELFLPRGWFLPVTPGTKFVTIGGAIASDVHGKNHHGAGCFGDHVDWIDLMLADGQVRRCSRSENADLLLATTGGMGLTGIILRAGIKLQPVSTAYIRQETIKASCLAEIMDLFEDSGGWTYSVAWIDCLSGGKDLGRSILFRGEHALLPDLAKKQQIDPLHQKARKKLTVPFNLPALALNTWTARTFNALYFRKAPKRPALDIINVDSFFYPLDALGHWNRIYGRRGFTQYQFVLPKETGRKGIETILRRIALSGQGSFLAVLKLFGAANEGMLSFPREGYTLALDFPITRNLFPLLEELDRMVMDCGGRLYLTKDVRMSKNTFDGGYPQADRFRQLKALCDPQRKLASLQSERLGI